MNISTDRIERLDEILKNLSSDLSTSELGELEKALIKNDYVIRNTTKLRGFKIPPMRRHRVVKKLKDLDEHEIFSIVLALRHMKEKEQIKDENVKLCWTGPKRGIKVRRTEQSISSILNRSKKSIDILGYYVTSHAKRIIGMLEKKLDEGIEVRMIINDLEKKEDLIDWLKSLDNSPMIYDWCSEDEGALLHAKCIVVDKKVSYIGSSNFTFHGMRKNLEIGVLVKDESMLEKIEALIENTIDDSRRFLVDDL